jgi:hypothetical protein
MEHYIRSTYGIPFRYFAQVMKQTNALCCGSVPLALYLKQEGVCRSVDSLFTPTDMDIFVTKDMAKPLQDMLEDCCFTPASQYSHDDDDDDYNWNHIVEVITYENWDSPSPIQVIVVDVKYPLLAYILQAFDLSICMTWWDAKTNEFHTFDPYCTRKLQMYTVNQPDPTNIPNLKKVKARMQKYKERKFRLVKHYSEERR